MTVTCACSPVLNGLGLTAPETAAIAALEDFLASFPAGAFDDFDAVFDTSSASGAGVNARERLLIIHGATLRALQGAVAVAGGIFKTAPPNADLTRRIITARAAGDPTIVTATIGRVDDVRNASENLIEHLKSGTATPLVTVPPPSTRLTRNTKLVLTGSAAVALAAGIGWYLVSRQRSMRPRYMYDY